MSNWTDIIKAVAPTAATLIAGPLGGLAVTAIGEALGMSEPTREKIEQALTGGQLTGEQIVALRTAEQNLKVRLRELDIRVEELEVQDRQSAREMQVKTGSRVTPTLALVVIGGFLGMAGGVLFGGLKADSVIAGTIIGYLSAKAEQVLSYYFGSSRGSDDKSGMLARLQEALTARAK
jgi:hypothetical protein